MVNRLSGAFFMLEEIWNWICQIKKHFQATSKMQRMLSLGAAACSCVSLQSRCLEGVWPPEM